MDNENKEQKLTDEEVWLRAYCAAISCGDFTQTTCIDIASRVLSDFKKRFRSNND